MSIAFASGCKDSVWIESALECGAHYPIHRESRIKMEREGVEATAIHNNCSGKHTGFISVACFSGEPVAGYIQCEHPVQQRVLNTLEEVTEESVSESPAGLDGCGVPVVGMSFARCRKRVFPNSQLINSNRTSDETQLG